MLFVTLCGCDFGHLLSAAPFPVLVRQGRVLMVLLREEGGCSCYGGAVVPAWQ